MSTAARLRTVVAGLIAFAAAEEEMLLTPTAIRTSSRCGAADG